MANTTTHPHRSSVFLHVDRYTQIALASLDAKPQHSGGWNLFGASPAKRSSKKNNKHGTINVNIVLDKLFDIVFAVRGIRIEQDAVTAAHGCLLTALRSSNDMLQHYLSRMMVRRGCSYLEGSIDSHTLDIVP